MTFILSATDWSVNLFLVELFDIDSTLLGEIIRPPVRMTFSPG